MSDSDYTPPEWRHIYGKLTAGNPFSGAWNEGFSNFLIRFAIEQEERSKREVELQQNLVRATRRLVVATWAIAAITISTVVFSWLLSSCSSPT